MENVAASHEYLNEGRTEPLKRHINRSDDELIKVDDVMDAVVISLRGIVLFPYEILPLRLTDQSVIKAIKEILTGSPTAVAKHIGVMLKRENNNDQREKEMVGTLIEILTVAYENEELLLTAKGISRFTLVNGKSICQGKLTLCVIHQRCDLILNAKCARNGHISDHFYHKINSNRLSKIAFEKYRTSIEWKGETIPWGNSDSDSSSNSGNGSSSSSSSSSISSISSDSEPSPTPLSSSSRTTAEEAVDHVTEAELHPYEFSYFLSSNLPLSNADRQLLLNKVPHPTELAVML